MDSNRPIAAPVVADIGSAMSALLSKLKPGQIQPQSAWIKAIGERKQKNVEKMEARLNANPSPMNFSSALRAIRDVLNTRPDIYVVNEGANTLDFTRNIIDMRQPRKRLDTGTWGVMGIGMGYTVAAALTRGNPLLPTTSTPPFSFSRLHIDT